MTVIDNVNYWMDVIMFSTFLAVVLFGGFGYYLIKVKKVAAKEEYINYENFDRKDASEFVKFDNIFNCSMSSDSGTFGVMVIDDYTFVAALDVKGYNFATASQEERCNTILNAVSLFNIVEKPIQMRQSATAIDIGHNIQAHRDILKELAFKQLDLQQEYDEVVSLAEQNLDNPDAMEYLESKIKQLQREIVSTKWETNEVKALIQYMESISSKGHAKKVNQLIFTYTYNPAEYVEELTLDEIYAKASQEIAIMANNYASAFGSCGCNCRLLTGMELLDLVRYHFHPVTADEVKIGALYNSSLSALFVTSDSLFKAEKARITEEQYKKRQEELKEEFLMRTQKAQKDMEIFKRDLLNEVSAQAEEEIKKEGGV
mgnify:CR=1 FL=1